MPTQMDRWLKLSPVVSKIRWRMSTDAMAIMASTPSPWSKPRAIASTLDRLRHQGLHRWLFRRVRPPANLSRTLGAS